MILPPLFGAHTRSSDNSAESIRLSFETIDLLSFNKAIPLINLTFSSLDTMNYDARTAPNIKMTYGVLDIMNYNPRNEPDINITYGIIDIMVYSTE